MSYQEDLKFTFFWQEVVVQPDNIFQWEGNFITCEGGLDVGIGLKTLPTSRPLFCACLRIFWIKHSVCRKILMKLANRMVQREVLTRRWLIHRKSSLVDSSLCSFPGLPVFEQRKLKSSFLGRPIMGSEKNGGNKNFVTQSLQFLWEKKWEGGKTW